VTLAQYNALVAASSKAARERADAARVAVAYARLSHEKESI
jgi:hypothetical protein